MAVDLPGIRARAEFDLLLFKQQEEIIKNALRDVANQMRSVPSARIRFDTGDVNAGTEQVKRSVRTMVSDVERDSRRLSQKIRQAEAEATQSARRLAEDETRRTRRHNADLLRDYDDRLKKRLKQIADEANAEKRRVDQADREAKRLAAKQERDQRGEERRLSRAELPVGVGLGVTGGLITKQLIDATGAAADFEKAMSQVRAVMSPKEWLESGAALTALARSLGGAGLGFTATEAAAGLEALTKAGISVKDQLAGAPAVLALAAAGGVQVGDAANFAASALATFGKTGEQLTEVANILTGVANATIADIDGLRMSFSQVASAGALTNQSLENITLGLGLMSQAGIRSSDAGTSLRVMLLRLIPQSEQAAQAMRNFGIIVNGQNRFIDEATGSFKGLDEIAQILQETLGQATQAQQQFALRTIFGQDAVRAATVLLKAGAQGFKELNEEASKTTALEVARTRLDNLRGDLTKLNSAWDNARITLGRALEPNLRPVVQSITQLLANIQNLTPEVSRNAMAIAGATGVTLTLTGAVLGAVAALKLFGVTSAAALGAITAIAPPVAALVVASAALSIAWVNNWGGIQEKTIESGGVILRTISEIVSGLDALKNKLAEDFGSGFSNLGAQLEQSGFGNVLKNLSGEVKNIGRDLGIDFGTSFAGAIKETILRNAPVLSALEFLRQRGADQQRIEGIQRQTEFQSTLTPEILTAQQEKLAIDKINDLSPVVRESIVRGFQQGFEEAGRVITQSDVEQKIAELGNQLGEAFTKLDPAEQFKVAHAAVVNDIVQTSEAIFQRLGADVKAIFDEIGIHITGDVLDDIINVFTAQAGGRLNAAAQANSQTYVGVWKRAFDLLNQNAQDFDRALGDAGTDLELIDTLLKLRDANEAVTKGYKDLADRGLAAALLAKRNEIMLNQDLEAKTRDLIALGQEFIAHKEAEARSLEEVTKWQKLQADIAAIGPKLMEERARNLAETVFPQLTAAQQIQIRTMQAEGKAAEAAALALRMVGVDAGIVENALTGTGAEAQRVTTHLQNLAKIPTVGLDLFIERANALANSALPGLTAAQVEHVKILQLQGEHLKAAQFAVVALGGDVTQLGAAMSGTGADIARVTSEIAELTKVRDPIANAFEITRDRAKAFLNTIIQGMPAATRAQLELVSATQGPLEALRQAWIRLGLDIAQLPDVANASARQIQEAQRKLEARQFFLETGELLPANKVQTAGQIFKEASKQAAENIAEARANITKGLQKAEQQWQDAVDKAADALAKAKVEFNKAIGKIDADLEKSLADINAAAAEAISSYNKTLNNLARQEDKLRADFERSQGERVREFQKQGADAARALAKQLQDTSRQVAQAVFDATNQQRQQLLQLAQQLAQLRSQEADAARNTSIRLEDIALKEFSARTHEEQQELARERIRLQAEQGAAAVELQKRIAQGQNDLRQQAEDAQTAMLRQVADASRQNASAINDFIEQQREAAEQFKRANEEAERQFREQLKAINEQRAEAAAALAKQLRELQKRREEARKQAEEAKKKAEEALREAQRQHDEAIDKANQQIETAEENAAEELAAAQGKFEEQMRVAREALAEARLQAGITNEIYRESQKSNELLTDLVEKWRPFEVNMNNMNIEEGDVEFLERAAERAEELAHAPIG